MKVTETHHSGRVRVWTAESEEDFVLRLLAANQDSGSLYPDIGFSDAVAWLRSHLRDLDIHPDFPPGLTGESAFYAADGPKYQSMMELRIVEAIARAHGTEQSIFLADEARTYLAWLEDHESCADMPQDWEPGNDE